MLNLAHCKISKISFETLLKLHLYIKHKTITRMLFLRKSCCFFFQTSCRTIAECQYSGISDSCICFPMCISNSLHPTSSLTSCLTALIYDCEAVTSRSITHPLELNQTHSDVLSPGDAWWFKHSLTGCLQLRFSPLVWICVMFAVLLLCAHLS